MQQFDEKKLLFRDQQLFEMLTFYHTRQCVGRNSNRVHLRRLFIVRDEEENKKQNDGSQESQECFIALAV